MAVREATNAHQAFTLIFVAPQAPMHKETLEAVPLRKRRIIPKKDIGMMWDGVILQTKLIGGKGMFAPLDINAVAKMEYQYAH